MFAGHFEGLACPETILRSKMSSIGLLAGPILGARGTVSKIFSGGAPETGFVIAKNGSPSGARRR